MALADRENKGVPESRANGRAGCQENRGARTCGNENTKKMEDLLHTQELPPPTES